MKRWVKYLLAVIAALVVLGICWEAKGQGCPDDYGCALYYRSDIWPRSGLRGYWRFDMGVQGDSLRGEGDFETWTGPEGGCTDCPTGWICSCASGDVDQESTIIYNFDRSLFIEPGAAYAPVVGKTMTFEANRCYQISWCHYGEAATEDFAVVATNAAFTDIYDWSTDTWGGGPTTTFVNIPASQTCARFQLNNGPVEKADYLIGFSVTSGDGDGVYVDQFRVERLNACNITGSMGNVLTNSVTSDPLLGHSEVLLPRVGTGPAGKSGMKTDGVDDHLLCADADCPMDPILWDSRGYFSVGCRVVTDTVATGSDYLITKWTSGGNQRSWRVYRSTAGLVFSISDDGTNFDENVVNVFVVDAFHNFVSTFDPSGGAGACENILYYNAHQTDVNATMTECAPFNSTADFQIGAVEGIATWSGSMLECAMWQRKLSAIESNKYISPHFPATNHGDGFWIDTCSQAAPHATCSTQICRPGTPNECQAEGTGVQACFGQYTEQLDNNYFGSFTGDDSNPDIADWLETEESGDGTAVIAAYRADVFYADVAVRMTTTGTTSYARLDQCVPVSSSTAYYGYALLKKLSGVISGALIGVVEYSDGACANYVTEQVLFAGDIEKTWKTYGDAFTTDGTTNSVVFRVFPYQVAADFLVGAVSLKAAPYHTPFIPCASGAAPCTATSRQYELHNPLSDFIEAEQKYGYEDGFCADAWVWTPWAGDDGINRYILNVPSTAGSNNRWSLQKHDADILVFSIYDSAGGLRQYYTGADSTNWPTGEWKYIEACSNNSDNVLVARHYNAGNSTWYDWATAAGAGTGIQDGQATDLHIGHLSNTNYLDGYTPKIHVSPYPTGNFVWPQKGWNNGRPPVNGRPY